jgi:GLPGLI family protein
MKHKIFTLIYLISFALFSQTKGKVTYRIEMLKDSIEQPYANPENTEMQNEVLETMHKSQPVEGYLVFNDSIAIYKAEEILGIPGWKKSNGNLLITTWVSDINFTWNRAGAKAIYYSDLSRDFIISQNDLMGTNKRIKKNLKEWIFTEESKEIDGYLCYKAVLKTDKKMKVWYTTEIPVNHGPKGLNGLPGLILEIEDNKFSWKATKINFDHYEADDIIEPQEGELISEEEFRKYASNIFKEN